MTFFIEDNRRQANALSLGLNLAGVGVITYSVVRIAVESGPSVPVWVWWASGTSLVAWVIRSVLIRLAQPSSSRSIVWGRAACEWAMIVAGGLTASAVSGLTIVPPLVAIGFVVGDIARPLALGLTYAGVGAVVVAVGAVPFRITALGVIGLEAGVVVATLVGISRRQFRANEQQARLLREQDLAVREEHVRLQLLADRQAVARDIHDVLAHSLGGLVIQLDAVEALLETGNAEGAARRVSDARALAASGLDEARRAVAALRDEPSPQVPGLSESVAELAATHRSLGGVVEVTTSGDVGVLDDAAASALRRALQESLSNARKHAPGEPVRVRLEWSPSRVRLTVSNPLHGASGTETGRTLANSGGGRGLAGMRERFAALPNGGSVVSGRDGASFVVSAEAALAGASRAAAYGVSASAPSPGVAVAGPAPGVPAPGPASGVAESGPATGFAESGPESGPASRVPVPGSVPGVRVDPSGSVPGVRVDPSGSGRDVRADRGGRGGGRA
jgi:signal transduction histidine kinase